MQKIFLDQIPQMGLPNFGSQKVFKIEQLMQSASISLIELLPGRRVPEEGASCHAEDEYSIFLEGEVYTESGDHRGVCGAGEATLIPRGERHWCENRTDKSCRLVCVMLRPQE